MIALPACTPEAAAEVIVAEPSGIGASLSLLVRAYVERQIGYAQAEALITALPASDPDATSAKLTALCALRHLQSKRRGN